MKTVLRVTRLVTLLTIVVVAGSGVSSAADEVMGSATTMSAPMSSSLVSVTQEMLNRAGADADN